MNALETTLAALDVATSEAAEAFERLIDRIEASETIAAKQLAEILQAAGKTPDDLRQRLAALAERRRLIVDHRRRSEVEASLLEVVREIEQHGHKIDAALEAMRAEGAPLHNRKQELVEELHRLTGATSALYSHSTNLEAAQRLHHAQARLGRMSDHIQDRDARRKELQQALTRPLPKEQAEPMQQELARISEALAPIELQAAELQSRVDLLNAQILGESR